MLKLYNHQKELIEKNPNKWLLSWSCGTGKTLAMIRLCDNKKLKTLVVCPKSVKDQWYKELDKWSVNKDLYHVLTKEEFRKEHKTIGKFEIILLDEIHFFSNYKSLMTKALLWYLDKYNIKYIYGATATPYLSTIWNIFTYGIIFGKCYKDDWYRWKVKYFTEIRMGHRTIPVQKNIIDGVTIQEHVKEKVNKMGNTVDINDCFDVPEQVFKEEYFELTRPQKKAIEDLLDVEPIACWTHTHQICGGFLKDDGYNGDLSFKSEKFKRAIELAKENKKVIIVCRYHNEIKNLRLELSKLKPVFEISGKIKQISEAQINKECVILIQAATSEGYELPDVPIMIFYSYDFSLKNFIQMKGRILRANHLKKNVYISLIVKNTIDHDIYKSMIKKEDFDLVLYNKKKYEQKGTIHNAKRYEVVAP